MESIGYRGYPKPYWGGPELNPGRPSGEVGSRTAGERVSPDPERASLQDNYEQMTIAEFVKAKFLPEHIATKRTPGRRHYQAILKHVFPPEEVDVIFGVDTAESKAKLKALPNWPYLNEVRLCDTHPEHIQRLVSAAMQSGYSTQTAKHIRNVVSAVFTHAIRRRYFAGENPAIAVVSPGMTRKVAHSLTFDQIVKVLQSMRYPELEISLLVILTGMNVAEICGLQWKHVNLADHSVNREGELIPPRTISVRSQWYRGELSNVPAGRRKNIPIPSLLHSMFIRLSRVTCTGWNDFVLITKGGRPINQINVAARRLKSIGETFEMPWLSWQVFRRTRASLVHEFGTQYQQRLAVAMAIEPDSPQITLVAKGHQPRHE